MKQTTHYSKVESVDYEFEESEIRDALLDYLKTERYIPRREVRFEIINRDKDEGGSTVILTFVYTTLDSTV